MTSSCLRFLVFHLVLVLVPSLIQAFTIHDAAVPDRRDPAHWQSERFPEKPDNSTGEPVYPNERSYISEDDIMLTADQEEAIFSPSDRKASDLATRWPDSAGYPYIPFTFVDQFVDRFAVWEAINHWEEHTCIDFEEVATTYSGPHIRFERHAEDCSSYVGVTSPTGQEIYLTEVCEKEFGDLVVEIGHAVGMWHEEMRSDRDTYIHINTANVLSEMTDKFFTEDDDSYGVPFDYSSIMFNHERVYTENGHITMATLDPLYQGVLGQRTGLSHMDKLLANLMYDCSAKLIAAGDCSTDTCMNNGYLSKTCTCVCPDGTSGSNCETVTQSYDEAILSPYTEEINAPTTISTPNYPNVFPAGLKFTKYIRAPECYNVVATFTAFDIYQRTAHYIRDGETADICWYDGLEIRTDDMLDGDWYCGTEIAAGQSFTSTSIEMVLYFKSTSYFKTGWSADITFVKEDGCVTSTTSSTSTSTSSTSSTSTSTSTSTSSTSSTTTPTTTTTSTSSTTTPTTTTTSTSSTSSTTTPTTTSTSSTSTSTSSSTSSTSSTTTPTTTTTTTPTTTTTSTSSTTTPTTTSTSSSSTSTSSTTTPTTTTTTSTPTSSSSTSTIAAVPSTTTAAVPSTTTISTSTSTATTSSTTATTTTTPYDTCTTSSDTYYYYLESPRYPSNYQNHGSCTEGRFETSLKDIRLNLEHFSLADGDSVVVQSQYAPPLTLTGIKSSGTEYRIGGSAIQTDFTADGSLTSTGFRLRYRHVYSACSRTKTVTKTTYLASPRYPNNHPNTRYCEYQLTAPVGYRMRVRFYTLKVPCSTNYLAFNRDPDDTTPFYDASVSRIYCGWGSIPGPFFSIGNRLNIYFKGERKNKGFKIKISLDPL